MEIEPKTGEIKVANKGKFPIDQVSAKISLDVKKGKEIVELGDLVFNRDVTLQPEESFQIQLYEKLEKLLQDSHLVVRCEVETPLDDDNEKEPWSDAMFKTIFVKHILDEFDLNLRITLIYGILQEQMSAKKGFSLKYRFCPEFLEPFGADAFRDAENYTVDVLEPSGTWLD